MIRAKDQSFHLRLRIVMHARSHGIRDAARQFGCARNTVRKWLRRYEQSGRAGLAERSRAPKSCPHKTSAYQEKKILRARDQTPCFGPRRLKDLYGLRPSQGAIARVLRQAGRTRPRRKKSQKKNDLRAVKARYRPFARLQADTKPLYDIPAYWPQMTRAGLPRQQYTHIDVKSGALFIDYADELSATYAAMASRRILEHLGDHGVELAEVVVSTDNGSEYGGGERRTRTIGYPATVRRCGAQHRFLPPATPNAHANVESSHASIEQEVFDLEPFGGRRDFFEKLTTYQRWWNFARINYSKGGKTPAQILEEEGVDPRILLLDPLDLDRYFRNRSPPAGVGHDLPVSPASSVVPNNCDLSSTVTCTCFLA
jgi:transposase-like protein